LRVRTRREIGEAEIEGAKPCIDRLLRGIEQHDRVLGPTRLEGELGGPRHDEDELAFLRDERDFRNCTLVELPRGDFAVTMLRNLAVAIFLEQLWQRLEGSSDPELAAIAGKAVKEAGKAAAAAVGRRLKTEIDEIRKAADGSKAGAAA